MATAAAPSFLNRMLALAVGQLKANPVALINTAAGITAALLSKLPIPPQAKGLVKGVLGALFTLALRSAVQPAAKDTSAVQAALDRVKAGRVHV